MRATLLKQDQNPHASPFYSPKQHQLFPGPTTQRLQAMAREYEMMHALGLAEKAHDALHDSAILINRDGTLLLKHRKVNILTELMTPPYKNLPVSLLLFLTPIFNHRPIFSKTPSPISSPTTT